jgi:hypothetical protein
MTEHLPECPCVHHPSEDLWCICWRLRECSTRTTAAAVQGVEALPGTGSHTPGVGTVLGRAAVIAAIKGEQDE